MCAKAVDVGTSFVVGAEIKDGKEEFRIVRNAFFSMEKEDFEDLLSDSGAQYIEKGKNIYILGEDALKFSMLAGDTKNFRRPMARGILNPRENDAIQVVEEIIRGVLGPPSYPGEVAVVTVPATPIESELDITFHRVVLERFLKQLGYQVKVINEALGIIFSENPSVTLEDGTIVPFTGVGISFGAGMTNLVVTWRAKQIFEISFARGGDWIDEQVAKMKGLPVSKVTATKEKKLDLRHPSQDPLLMALEIYYEELIRSALEGFAEYFEESQRTIDVPLDIVLAGGSTLVPGFLEKFQSLLQSYQLPFEVGKVYLAKDPFRAVARGALVAAISAEKKKQRETQKLIQSSLEENQPKEKE